MSSKRTATFPEIKRLILCLCSGILMSLTIYPVNLSLLAWVALVPLLVAIRGQRLWKTFLYGLLTGSAYFPVLTSWIILYDVRIFFKVLLLILPFIGFFCVVLNYLTKNLKGRASKILVAPLVWISVMSLYSLSPIGSMGGEFATFQGIYLLQIVRLFGAKGITFLILTVNSTIASRMLNKDKSTLRFSLLTAFIILVSLAYGAITVQAGKRQGEITVAVVQPNFPHSDTWRYFNVEEIFEVGRWMSLEAAKTGAVLIVWPQYTLPIDVYRYPQRLANLAKETGSFIMLGTYTPNKEGQYNIGLVFSPKGEMIGEYRAVHPPPFRQIGQVTGKEYSVIETPFAKLGIMLCYDDTSAEVARKLVKEGAEILFAIVNDGDFGRSKQLYLHLSRDILRAIENKRYVVRSAATGISAIIDPYGRILKRTEILKSQIIAHRIAPIKERTFFNRYGDLLSLVSVVSVLCLWMKRRFKGRPSKKGNS